ncbi:MAG: glycosyltransferase [Methylobacteriaceae bacterium]|nr:glycosyltransferase [Methylobacteriaceae bacterium]
MTYRLVLMHPMDPRGGKLGGIETHVRLVLSRHPADFSVLFVGVDEFGDCELGRVRQIVVDGRRIDFLPVAFIPGEAINLASKTLAGSTTFRFALGAIRHLLAIRRAIGAGRASADLQRFEFALIPRLIGLPAVQMVHGEGSREQKMDSLIKKLWFLHAFNEKLALTLARRILCVNPNIVKRMTREFPRQARKAEVMTVSVDTQRFAAQPFDTRDGVFRIVFAGRLDEFKDPPLMFRMLAKLHRRLGGRLAFDYVGTSDPHRYAEFAAIESFTARHGYQNADGVAAIVARAHAGVLTSYFEGMPCYLLETLSVGRPFAALRLPQYDPLIAPGVSGALVERSDPPEACENALVEAFAQLRDDIFAGRIDPSAVHRKAAPYSVEAQMARLFAHHRALQDDAPEATAPQAATG